jgi:hypothetical protein
MPRRRVRLRACLAGAISAIGISTTTCPLQATAHSRQPPITLQPATAFAYPMRA